MTKRRFLLLWPTSVLVTFALSSALRAADGPQTTEPTIVIGDNSTIRVTQPDDFFISLDASHFPKDALSKVITPTINDLNTGSDQGTSVTFTEPTKVFAGETEAIWKFKVTVKPALAPNSSQSRKAAVTLDKDYAKDYTLTNLPAGTVNWSVPPVPTPWTINWSSPPQNNVFGFVVTAQDLPATNLRIATASFKDSSGAASFGAERLQLVETPNSTGDGKFSLKGRDTHTFYLRFKDDAPRTEGKFSGAVSFAIDERPDLQTLQVTLNATSDRSRFVGVALLAIGLLISWWTTARARPAIARLQAEKPVIALRNALDQFRKDLGAVPSIPGIAYPEMINRVANLNDMITIKRLDEDSLLPSSFALSLSAVADSSTLLQARLADVSAKLLAMSTVLNNGILKITSQYSTVPQWKKDRALIALPQLDPVGATAMTDTDANTRMAPILAAYDAPPPNNVQSDSVPRSLVVEPVSVQEINYRIEHFSNVGWWIWGVVSVVVGCAILVVPNPGFGTLMDWILCFLWGLGIPTASAKLQELTPSGVGANVGVTFPKVGS
jgi:hypothetical protein